jgi:hypothetical protein
VTPGDCPRRKYLKGAPIGLAVALPSNSMTPLEKVSKDKCSSLFGLVVSDKGKTFYNIGTWKLVTKNMFNKYILVFLYIWNLI